MVAGASIVFYTVVVTGPAMTFLDGSRHQDWASIEDFAPDQPLLLLFGDKNKKQSQVLCFFQIVYFLGARREFVAMLRLGLVFDMVYSLSESSQSS